MGAIRFFHQDISFKVAAPIKTRKWLREVIRSENRQLLNLNYIFCSDAYLLSINQQYLNHNTLTDIITFDNKEEQDEIESDIFISIDRVRENADKLKVEFDQELHRVLVHGVLHLCGYKDKTPAQRSAMRKREDAYLSLRCES
jgi:probable rRNA maturation factor